METKDDRTVIRIRMAVQVKKWKNNIGTAHNPESWSNRSESEWAIIRPLFGMPHDEEVKVYGGAGCVRIAAGQRDL